jgi:6-phosphogluconolactonase
MTADRNTLLVVSDTLPGVLHFVAEPTNGRLYASTFAAEVPKALSIATLQPTSFTQASME